jgi:hypothetical protein|tara:strand:- start:1556 stop:1741 length:186 start_codon:yes stop_codon:yes gene_type:complete
MIPRKTKHQIAKAEYAAECERRGMKVLYVDKDTDTTKIRGLSYDYVIIDEFVDIVNKGKIL